MQLILSTVCLALTSVVIGNAYYQKKQFYPAVVYMTKSNASMAIMYIQFFVIVFMFGKLLRKIFLGTLRAAEFEHLLERFWYALTETCLAFTVFRDDFNPRFVGLFTVLLFLKSFHWLAEERVDFMERSPVLGWLFHIRVASLLVVLGSLDYMLLMHAYNSTLVRGPTVQLVFGFEYAILLTVVASTAIKYVLHAAEMRTDTPWENKAVFLLYTELVIGLIKVVLYVLFVVIMAKIYALPMFVFRPMFFTIRNFKKALSDVIMSRRAIRNMNTLYPDATPEELRLSDNICIICREDMVNHSKKLPCGHIFHTTCLRSWFQRQQTCPTCRLNILRAPAANSTALPRGVGVDDAAAAGAAAGAADGVAVAGAALLNAEQPLRLDGAAVAAAMPNIFDNLNGATPLPNTIPNFPTAPNFAAMPMGMPPPFMLPPPFPFIAPYAVPPPPMPADLTTFTDEELKALEGNERQHVEERIKMLRNIQLMLDAAGILMNNYQIVAARMQLPTQPQTTTANAAAAAAAATTSASSAAAAPDTDGPSTSAAAAAFIKSVEQAANANANASQATAKAALNAAATLATITPTAAAAAASSISSSASSSSPSPIDKHNQVTIEDLGGEEHYVVDATAASCTSTLITPAESSGASQSSHDIADDNTELSELRKRRLKFLEERNKSTTSATD